MSKPDNYSQKQWKTQKYCSRSCSYEARKNRVKVSCAQCGSKLTKRPSRVRERNFCDHDCHNKYREKKKTVSCDWCDESITRIPSLLNDMNYCSHHCLGKGTAAERGHNEPETIKCEFCDEKFQAFVSDARKYCSTRRVIWYDNE